MNTGVLHVIARMNLGGTARYVSDLMENIPDSALATGYVQGMEVEDPAVNSIPTIRIPSLGRKISPLNDFKAWIELRRIIQDQKPLIVHTHTFKAGVIGRLIGGNHSRVHTFHGHLFDDQSFSKVEKLVITSVEKFLANRTDLLISVGEKVGNELRAAGIGKNRKWLSIPPGVTALATIEKAEARKIFKVQSSGLIFGWMARVTEVKNPTMMLDIARKLPNHIFLMAGGGNLFEEIKRDAPKNLKVLGWVDASTFWSAVDCGISTSDNEGMPIALIEAQLAGIPVVATDAGSNAEVVINDITGIITTKNADNVVAAITKMTSDITLRASMGHEAKIRATSRFDKQKMINTHKQIYISLGHQVSG